VGVGNNCKKGIKGEVVDQIMMKTISDVTLVEKGNRILPWWIVLPGTHTNYFNCYSE
jgi:hypothetical protein